MVSLKKFLDLRTAVELEKQMLEARLTQIREALQGTNDSSNGEEPFICKISVQQQQRLDYLMDKNNQGLLSPGEKRELSELAASAQRLSILNAKALLAQKQPREETPGRNGTNAANTHNLPRVRRRPQRRFAHA